MNPIRDVAEFRSAKFEPFLGQEAQVNPEVYGVELAFWLSRELAARGVFTSYPQSEDWGWYLEYSAASGAEFAIHCGNIGGTRDTWMLSLRRFRRKLFGRDNPDYAEAASLVAAIRDILSNDPDVVDLQWRYAEKTSA